MLPPFSKWGANLGGSVGCASAWRSGGRGFDPRRDRQHSFLEIDLKYFLQSFSLFRWFKKGNCQFLAKECAQYWLTALTPLGWLGRKTSTQTKFSKRGYSHRKNLLPGKWSCSLKETNVSADSKFFPFSLWVAILRRESYTRKVNSLQLDWLPFKKKANTFICEYFFWGVTLRNCFCGIQETVYSVDHLQS